MAKYVDEPKYLSVEELADLFGLPLYADLLKEGLDVKPELYAGLVHRMAKSYLNSVVLDLTQAGESSYELVNRPGYDWRDAAYWVGHLLNLYHGKTMVQSEGHLLKYNVPKGGKPYGDLKQAVVGNLPVLGKIPQIFNLGDPGETLKKAIEDATLVEKVRKESLAA